HGPLDRREVEFGGGDKPPLIITQFHREMSARRGEELLDLSQVDLHVLTPTRGVNVLGRIPLRRPTGRQAPGSPEVPRNAARAAALLRARSEVCAESAEK